MGLWRPSRSVLRAFRCPGGTLTITFTSTPPDVKQRSDWKVVKGLGSFEGLSGGGRMRGVLESRGGGAARPSPGRSPDRQAYDPPPGLHIPTTGTRAGLRQHRRVHGRRQWRHRRALSQRTTSGSERAGPRFAWKPAVRSEQPGLALPGESTGEPAALTLRSYHAEAEASPPSPGRSRAAGWRRGGPPSTVAVPAGSVSA